MSQTQLCVLFADVAGSTRLYEKLGDAEALRAIERCMNRLQRAAESNRGRVVKTIGDAVMAVFPDAAMGTQAACEMQRRIADLPPVSGAKLAVRIGFHFGPALEENGDVFGDTVNVAARMGEIAKAGQIIATAETLAALADSGRTATREIDTLAVKGKHDDVRVCEVIWQDSDDLTMKAAGIAVAEQVFRLRLRHGDRELVLGPDKPSAVLGRDLQCDLAVRDPRASRSHARIERRRGKYMLADQSTNGTYVTFAGENEFVLKREEVMLKGRGRLSFGHSASDDATGVVEFEVL